MIWFGKQNYLTVNLLFLPDVFLVAVEETLERGPFLRNTGIVLAVCDGYVVTFGGDAKEDARRDIVFACDCLEHFRDIAAFGILHHFLFYVVDVYEHLLRVNLGIVERDAVDGCEYFFCQAGFLPRNEIHGSYHLSGIFRQMDSCCRINLLVVMGIYVIVITLCPFETP